MKKIEFDIIHWNTTEREPKFVLLWPDQVDEWAKRIAEQAQKGAALAQYREKMHNQQDVKYLMEKHQDEVAKLKRQIASDKKLILKITELLTDKSQ